MRLSYLSLIVALGMAVQPALAQDSDPGASGVIDGSDVRQFLDSGARFNPTRMEEASRRFDKMIKMPPRLNRAKNWNEVIQRDQNLQISQPTNTQVVPGNATGAVNAVNAGGAAGVQNTQTNQTNLTNQNPQEKHRLIKKVGRGLEEAAEVVGFPVADEFLPNDVDAKLSGDLPDGEDPRVYVHPKESDKAKQARESLLEQAENRGASAEEVIPEGNNQPPAVIVE
ncbi:MAG: hypothetical protein R3C24_19800 [Cyanobacteriota/Melainabacteria group bacterium]